MKYLCLIILYCFISNVSCSDESSSVVGVFENVINYIKTCDGSLTLCLKERALTFVDNLRQSKQITITKGVSLVGESNMRSPRKYEPLPNQTLPREVEVESRLVESVYDIVSSKKLQVSLEDDKESGFRSLSEARKKKKNSGGGMMLPLLLLLALKKKLFILGLLALKKAIFFKIALIAAAFLIFSDMGQPKTTYEIVPHAQHQHKEHHHVEHVHEPAHYGGGGGDDWAKEGTDPHSQAYSGYGGYHK